MAIFFCTRDLVDNNSTMLTWNRPTPAESSPESGLTG